VYLGPPCRLKLDSLGIGVSCVLSMNASILYPILLGGGDVCWIFRLLALEDNLSIAIIHYTIYCDLAIATLDEKKHK
jgi:hypothetical protein